ncbi:unnamed protein product [Amoebophrya sp. A25]|nr:unnamed protein product [Amoebophrya sp. A25]|eukprot:GSA25T00007241001.1
MARVTSSLLFSSFLLSMAVVPIAAFLRTATPVAAPTSEDAALRQKDRKGSTPTNAPQRSVTSLGRLFDLDKREPDEIETEACFLTRDNIKPPRPSSSQSLASSTSGEGGATSSERESSADAKPSSEDSTSSIVGTGTATAVESSVEVGAASSVGGAGSSSSTASVVDPVAGAAAAAASSGERPGETTRTEPWSWQCPEYDAEAGAAALKDLQDVLKKLKLPGVTERSSTSSASDHAAPSWKFEASEEYTKMEECADEMARKLKSEAWCPYFGSGGRETRNFLEQIMGLPIPTSKPKALKPGEQIHRVAKANVEQVQVEVLDQEVEQDEIEATLDQAEEAKQLLQYLYQRIAAKRIVAAPAEKQMQSEEDEKMKVDDEVGAATFRSSVSSEPSSGASSLVSRWVTKHPCLTTLVLLLAAGIEQTWRNPPPGEGMTFVYHPNDLLFPDLGNGCNSCVGRRGAVITPEPAGNDVDDEVAYGYDYGFGEREEELQGFYHDVNDGVAAPWGSRNFPCFGEHEVARRFPFSSKQNRVCLPTTTEDHRDAKLIGPNVEGRIRNSSNEQTATLVLDAHEDEVLHTDDDALTAVPKQQRENFLASRRAAPAVGVTLAAAAAAAASYMYK